MFCLLECDKSLTEKKGFWVQKIMLINLINTVASHKEHLVRYSTTHENASDSTNTKTPTIRCYQSRMKMKYETFMQIRSETESNKKLLIRCWFMCIERGKLKHIFYYFTVERTFKFVKIGKFSEKNSRSTWKLRVKFYFSMLPRDNSSSCCLEKLATSKLLWSGEL